MPQPESFLALGRGTARALNWLADPALLRGVAPRCKTRMAGLIALAEMDELPAPDFATQNTQLVAHWVRGDRWAILATEPTGCVQVNHGTTCEIVGRKRLGVRGGIEAVREALAFVAQGEGAWK